MTLNAKEKAVLDLIKKGLEYQHYFFKKVTEVKWFYPLKNEGYFSPDKVPGPESAEEKGYFRIPYWSPLYYLERIAEQIKENEITGEEKIKYAKELLEIIKNVSTYRDEEGNHIDNYHVWHSFVKILSNLPNELITMDIIDLIPVWLDSRFLNDLQTSEIVHGLLPKFLTDNKEDIEKAERIIYHITGVKITEKGKELIVKSYSLEEMFKKYSSIIGEKCSVNVIKNLAERIKSLLINKTQGTLRSFYTEREYLDNNVELLSYGLREIMLAKARKEPSSLEFVLEEFLEDDNFIFPKIALFVIAENMDKFRDLFWRIVNTDVGIKIFEYVIYWGDELRHVLENLGTLSNEEREILKEKIEIGSNKLIEKHKELKRPEEFISLHKQKIYKALSYDECFRSLYEEMKKITGRDAELGPAVKVGVKTGWGKSPLSEDEILEMSNEELAGYLSEFKTEDFWEGPTVEALAETLRVAAKAKPEKFVDNLTPFINTGYLYISKLLRGFEEAVKEGKFIDWEKVLDFIFHYINRREFWENKLIVEPEATDWRATYTWVISSISSLLMAGIENGLSLPELFEKTEEIILLILNNWKYKSTEEEIDNYIFYVLNTPFGQILESYIKLVLKTSEVMKEETAQEESIVKFKENFDKLLSENSIEAYTWFGFYLPQLYYHLDKEWVKEEIVSLEKIKHTTQWEAFMSGYLSANRVYKEIYELMREHYKLSINYKFKDKDVIKNLIAHVSIAYLNGDESMEPSSLFYEIVKEFKSEYIRGIIQFFWIQEKNGKKEGEKIKKILDFWGYIYNKLKPKKDSGSLTEKDEIILSDLSKLTVFLPSITEKYKEWLLLSAPYVEKNYNTPFFIEYLDELKNKGKKEETAKNIGEIFLTVLEECSKKELLPSYPEDRIKSIVEFLCEIPTSKEYGRRICNLYAKNGLFFLKEIYEKCENGGDI